MKHEEARCFVVQCGAEKFIFAMKTVSFRFGKVTRTAWLDGPVDSGPADRTTHIATYCAWRRVRSYHMYYRTRRSLLRS